MGTYTNAGVVGEDNAHFGWLKRYPHLRDLPCRDIILTGENFPSDNPLTPEPNDRAETGACSPFGTKTTPGQMIRGQMPCNGSEERYQPPGKPRPPLLLATPPNTPPQPAAIFGVHSSSNGFDFSRNPAFGFVGQAFVAQFGDQAPVSGKTLAPVGFKVVCVDVSRGVIEDFAVNKGSVNGPASRIGGGMERPVAARFDPSGMALYVVDFGVMTVGEGSEPRTETGVLWRITPTSQVSR